MTLPVRGVLEASKRNGVCSVEKVDYATLESRWPVCVEAGGFRVIGKSV